MDVNQFLEKFAPGYSDLSQTERAAIWNFTMLWTAMEGLVLHTHGSPAALLAAVDKMKGRDRLDPSEYGAPLAYFRDRYFRDGAFTHNYADLRFKTPEPMVEAVISGGESDPVISFKALVLIVYRLRNNLFHGVKWEYGIRGQQLNFEHGASVLMCVLKAFEGHND